MRFIKLLIIALVLVTVLMVSTPGYAQQWAGIIAPSRAANWGNVGVTGGNPATGGLPSDSWSACATTACTALTTPANVTAANINTAIAAAPANTYIQLPAGTFTMSTGLVWNHVSHVELRGQGANQTFLSFTNLNSCQGASTDICIESSDTNYNYGPSNVANWTAGYAQGATSITLSSVTNLQVGWPLILDQVDDTTDGGDIYICGFLSTCSYTSDAGGGVRTGRSQSQFVTVTSISGSGPYTVGISPGLYMPNWNAVPGTSLPQAWWATGPVFYDGIRNMSLDHTASLPPNGIDFFNCANCWVSGIRNIMGTTGSSETHIQFFESMRITVQNSYFFQTANTATVQYGIEPFPSSDSLIQNNIFQTVSAPIPINGPCSGCVVAYNFDVNNWFGCPPCTWNNQGEFLHSVIDHVLFEGNEGAGLYSDNSHGTHHFQTIFRSAGSGYQQNNGTLTTGSTIPIQVDAFSRFYNIIGNVWGSPALPHTVYQYIETAPQETEIYSIGWGDEVTNDPNVSRTLMRWGNYSIVAQSSDTPANSGIRFVSSEVPSGITSYANSVPANNTLPSSFYMTVQPSWWNGIPWPAIGPDVTGGNVGICLGGTNKGAYVTNSSQCPSSTVSSMGGHINAIPAMNCYLNAMGGSSIGSGSALPFDAKACYASGTAQVPAPPTNLKATVQ